MEEEMGEEVHEEAFEETHDKDNSGSEANDDDEYLVKCVVEKFRHGSSSKTLTTHSLGTSKPPKAQTKGPMDAFSRLAIKEFVDARRSGKTFQTIVEKK